MLEDTTSNIIAYHRARYPKMQVQDMIKLLYQRRMGPGHFIANAEAAREFLFKEWHELKYTSLVSTEEVGGGFSRVYLSSLKYEELPLLLERFLEASKHVGSVESLLDDLHELMAFYPEGTDYISEYIASGCPIMSHSETYRQFYHPAYRVVFSGE